MQNGFRIGAEGLLDQLFILLNCSRLAQQDFCADVICCRPCYQRNVNLLTLLEGGIDGYGQDVAIYHRTRSYARCLSHREDFVGGQVTQFLQL